MPKPSANDLKAHPLFASVSAADRELLASNLDVLDVASGSVVIGEGDANESFFVVHSGDLDVFVGKTRRATLGPNGFFGEISLQHEVPATASVVAKTPATLYVLSKSAWRALLSNTDAVLRIRGAMTNREAADRLFGGSSPTR